MNGIPKFLLPINLLGDSLLYEHIRNAGTFYENILVGIRPELRDLVSAEKLSSKVQIYELSTNSMTQTILDLIKKSKSDRFSVVMPDTFFQGDNPHSLFSESEAELVVATWKIRLDQRGKLGQLELRKNTIIKLEDKNPNCKFENAWGSMSFTRNFVPFLDSESPHIGYGLKKYLTAELPHEVVQMKGGYYDCGTPSEYFALICKLTSKL